MTTVRAVTNPTAPLQIPQPLPSWPGLGERVRSHNASSTQSSHHNNSKTYTLHNGTDTFYVTQQLIQK